MHEKSNRVWLEGLWEDHAGQIRAYIQRRAATAVVDDLLSDVYVVAWRHRERRPRKPLPWLYGIARRVVSTHYRSLERRQNLDARIEAHLRIGQAIDPEGQAEISQALSELGEDDREILLLTAWEGLTPTEIASATGSNAPAVRMRLSRARRRFAKAFEIDPIIEGAPK